MEDAEEEHESWPSQHLLQDSSDEVINRDVAILSTTSLWDLYLSHTLSIWNARTYEFAAVSGSSLLSLCVSTESDLGRFSSPHRLSRILCWLRPFGMMTVNV